MNALYAICSYTAWAQCSYTEWKKCSYTEWTKSPYMDKQSAHTLPEHFMLIYSWVCKLYFSIQGEKKGQRRYLICQLPVTQPLYCVHSQSQMLIEINLSNSKWLHITCPIYSASEAEYSLKTIVVFRVRVHKTHEHCHIKSTCSVWAFMSTFFVKNFSFFSAHNREHLWALDTLCRSGGYE